MRPFGLEPHIYHYMLIRQFDDGAGHDVIVVGLCGRFGGLLAIEGFQSGGKVFHAGQFCIVLNREWVTSQASDLRPRCGTVGVGQRAGEWSRSSDGSK